MSDYGLVIKNSAGKVVIDSVYKNYTYYESGTSSLVPGINEISITNTTSHLVLVLKPNTDAYMIPYGFLDTTTPGTFESIMIAADATCECEWILYRDGQTTTTNDNGLIIYDSTANVIFNSNETGYVNILNHYYWSLTANDETATNDITVNDSNNYFNIQGTINLTKTVSLVARYYQVGFKKIDSTTVRMGHVITKSHSVSVAHPTAQGSLYPMTIIEYKAPPSI